MLEADSKVWDQNAFNDLMRRGNRADPARPDRLFWCAVHLDAYRAATHLACWRSRSCGAAALPWLSMLTAKAMHIEHCIHNNKFTLLKAYVRTCAARAGRGLHKL